MRRERAVDVALALVVFALSVGLLVVPEEGARRLDLVGVALAAVASLPLIARRRAPLGVFVVTVAGSAVLNALEYSPGPPFGPIVALYFVALSRGESRKRLWLTGTVVFGAFAIHLGAFALPRHAFPGAEILLGAAVFGGAWLAGDRTRLRRQRVERERRLAVAEERTRIARDLHDSAGHAINVILVQAGAARLLQERDPAAVRKALTTIEEVARETLGEIDQLVSALREGRETEVEPPLGLSGLESLVGRQRAAGLAVDLRVQGDRRALPPALGQAAYRIVQEALTNAARHGEGGASVEVAFGSDALDVLVTNPARPEAADGEGHGIVGMRERALLLGGSLDAGAADGAFTVRARLPYGGGKA